MKFGPRPFQSSFGGARISRVSVRRSGGGQSVASGAKVDNYAVDVPTTSLAVSASVPFIASTVRLATTLPMLTAHLSVVTGVTDTITAEFPALSAQMRGGGRMSADLPMLTAGLRGTTTVLMQISVPLPALTASLFGATAGTVRVSAVLPSLAGAFSGGEQLRGVLPALTAALTGKTGSVSHIDVELPAITARMSVTTRTLGIIQAALPMLVPGPAGRIVSVLPMLEAGISGKTVVAVTYEAYAVNLNHDPRPGAEPIDEVTRYTNYPFNQIVRYRDAYYGVANNGIYLLGGTTDYAVTPTAVPYAFKTALTDNKTPFKKRIAAARFAGRVGPAATITLYLSEPDANAYNYVTPRDADPQNYRQKFGRGAKARYFGLGAAGDGELELDTLEPEIEELTRKI